MRAGPEDVILGSLLLIARLFGGLGLRYVGGPRRLSLAPDLCEPPAQADEEKAPIADELGWFALDGMSDELKRPADDE
jgi:hypothetical protein